MPPLEKEGENVGFGTKDQRTFDKISKFDFATLKKFKTVHFANSMSISVSSIE